MWNTVLVRAAEQWGGLDAIPGGGKDHSCHAKCEGNRAGNPQGWEVGGNSQHEAAPKLV